MKVGRGGVGGLTGVLLGAKAAAATALLPHFISSLERQSPPACEPRARKRGDGLHHSQRAPKQLLIIHHALKNRIFPPRECQWSRRALAL